MHDKVPILDAWSAAFHQARVARSWAQSVLFGMHPLRRFPRRVTREHARIASRYSRSSQEDLNAAFDALHAEQARLYGGASRWSWQ